MKTPMDNEFAAQYGKSLKGDLHTQLQSLRPKLAEAAQEEYDAWDQSDLEYGDPELGFGGICQNIAEAFGSVLGEHGIDSVTLDTNGVGDQHVWVAAHDHKDAFHVDIYPHHYETGGGYNWKKKPGVKFTPDHISIEPADREHLDIDEEDAPDNTTD